MNTLKRIMILTILSLPLIFGGCGENSLFFPVEDDVQLGLSVVEEIEANPTEYPILSEAEYPEAYSYLNAMKDEILSSSNIQYADIFPYELTIIHRDDVLNAFAAPGGYMYVYTGLIHYLDRADDLAGVIGHEIAHADRRHSISQMRKQFGLSVLISVVAGENSGQLANVVGNLLNLKFSREDETEADDFSVKYLGDTRYACNGAAAFFQKIEDEGQCQGNFAFLSTHPDPCQRVDDINAKAEKRDCSTVAISETDFNYQDFKNSLP